MAPSEEDVSAGSILRELIFNQYQAIVLGGVAVASLLTLNPLPILVWLGTELVLVPMLDSGPLRRLVARRRREISRAKAAEGRARQIASFDAEYAERYEGMEKLCRTIEANYESLSGISQSYLSEQRGKLDNILDGCLHRMLALQRYEKLPLNRKPQEITKEIENLEKELAGTDLNDRARTALMKNLELKRKLMTSYSEVGGTIKALSTELDSMASLLEVLHQSSISLRDPHAISEELDTIVRQSENSEKAVREMEALLRSDTGSWGGSVTDDAAPASTRPRQKVRGR